MLNSFSLHRRSVIGTALLASVLLTACGMGRLGGGAIGDDDSGGGPRGGNPSGGGPNGGAPPPVPGGSQPLPPAPSCAAAEAGSATVAAPELLLQLQDDDEGAWLGSPAVADLDGDGANEIIITHNGNLVVWNADGSPKWRFDDSQDSGRIWASPVVADFRDDGKLEIVFAARTTIYMLDASGQVVSGFPIRWQDEMRSLAAGDVDGDGQLDIVVMSTDRGPDVLHAFHASGAPVAGFPPVQSGTIGCDNGGDSGNCWIVGGYDQNLAIGDLDGDGKQDIVATMDNSYVGFYRGTGEAFDANPMYRNRPKTPGVRYLHDLELAQQGFSDDGGALQGYFKNSAPAIADIDGDGVVEIVMLAAVEDVDMADQARGVGLWAVHNDASRLPGWESPFHAQQYLSGGEDLGGNIVAETNQVTVADIDATHPGPELIFAGLDGLIHAVYADKKEFWSVPFTQDTDVLTGGVVVADLSGDGIPEIVFNTYSATEGKGNLFVLDAGGNLLHKVPLPRLGAMPVPTIADVNGDGTLEIVVSLRAVGWDGSVPEPNAYVYTVPSASTNCLLWPTARGNLYRNGWIRPAR